MFSIRSKGGSSRVCQIPFVLNLSSLTPPPSKEEFPVYEPKAFFHYEVLYQSKKSNARVGRITTPHGVIDTPGFVAVGTNGALKGVSQRDADHAGLQLMFANTYHLLVQPGPELIKNAGGLHKFINRQQPIITDSGGFQVFSLAYGSVHDELSMKSKDASYQKNKFGNQPTMVKVTEDGAIFKSYRDGKLISLTPESSVQAQKDFGADIIIPLDELPPYHISEEKLIESVFRTHRWEARSLKEHLKNINQQAMYGVIHGGIDRDLRKMSIEYLTSLPFDGFAIGGSIGKNRTEMLELLKFVTPLLPSDKPNHLLGIADEESIRSCIPLGIDTFDSCFPTRLARHGNILSNSKGKFKVTKSEFSQDFNAIDQDCDCSTCKNHSVAYLHHLFKSKEPNAIVLATTHNVHYMSSLMGKHRARILNGDV